jgi:hypothetical protein
MAVNTVINGVTKAGRGNLFVYFFPLARITADNDNEVITFAYLNGYPTPETIAFSAITEKGGTSTPEEYCDYLANEGAFF